MIHNRLSYLAFKPGKVAPFIIKVKTSVSCICIRKRSIQDFVLLVFKYIKYNIIKIQYVLDIVMIIINFLCLSLLSLLSALINVKRKGALLGWIQ